MPVLQVTAHLGSPVAAQHPLHLDAVLAAAAVGTGHHLQRTTPASEILDPPIPILRLHVLGARCALCTAWIWPADAGRGREHFTTRKDAEDIELRAGPWHVASGGERARQMPVATVEAATVNWIVVGNRKGLRDALRYVTQVGRLRRQGYGVVTRWNVEPVPVPPERTLVDPDGRAARHLPPSWAYGTIEPGAYEAPYWHPARCATGRHGTGMPVQLLPDVKARLETCR